MLMALPVTAASGPRAVSGRAANSHSGENGLHCTHSARVWAAAAARFGIEWLHVDVALHSDGRDGAELCKFNMRHLIE